MRRHPLGALAAAALLLCAAADCPAADPAPPAPSAQLAPQHNPALRRALNLARELIARGRFADAETTLDAAAQIPGADPTAVAFLRGIAALAAGQHDRAANIFNGILVEQPALLRVRLELARSLFLKNSPKSDRAARRHFERVLQASPPPTVAANIRAFLDAIRRRRAWDMDFAFSLLPDSNINRAPTTRTVTIGGLPFTLADDARETSGVGLFVGLGGSYRWTLTDNARLAWSGYIQRREYERGAFDDMTVETAIGPRFIFAGGERGAALFASRRYFGGRPYNTSFGIRADTERLLSAKQKKPRRLRLHAEVRRRSHDRDRGLDGDAYSIGAGWRFAANTAAFYSLQLNYARHKPKAPWLQNRAPNLSIGYHRDFGRGLSVSLEAQTAAARYAADHPLFATTRRDRAWIAGIKLAKRTWNIKGFTPVLSLSHIRNRSNITINNYRRTLAAIGMRQAF